ncbi:MAG: hypothetical protein E6343_12610 [Clostridium perfringens]|nr:hypothetical protein [Clostridium perfringens]
MSKEKGVLYVRISEERIIVSFNKKIIERIGIKKMESYADEIAQIIERINEEL